MRTIVLEDAAAAPRLAIDYVKELNPEQLRVVREGEGPCLVLAGAGSGKTRTITYRVAWLLEHGVAPEEILLLTFTNKAAAEMLRRVEGLLQGSTRGIWGGTFHAVANRALRIHAESLGYTGSFTIMDAEDGRSLLKVCAKEEGADPAGRRYPSPAVIADLVSFSRNACVPLAEALERRHPSFADLEPWLAAVAARYARRKREANAMDFDDLLANFLRLLEEHPAALARLSRRFRYVLVDEYQDTNPIQARIVDLLASGHGNLLVVGDDAQSIYSFRAATVENILSFPKRFPGARVFRLETNYRSTPEILALANDVIARNVRQFPKELRPMRAGAGRPVLVPAPSGAEEAAFVAQTMLRLRDAGTPLRAMAVLFRATHHSQDLEFELAKRGIPYDYRGGMKFFERAHVKDVIAFLKLRTNPKDALAWIRTLSLQTGIGETGAGRLAERLARAERLEDVTDALAEGALAPRMAAGWRDMRAILRRVAASPRPAEAIRAVASSSYATYLELEYPNARDRLDDLEQLALFAEGYEAFEPFLSEVTLKDDYGAGRDGRRPEDEDRPVLSTVHQAKGLEWDAVFVIRMGEGSFPNPRALEDEAGLEEERRLFYVAVTRARKELHLSYAVASGYDTLAFHGPSPFLREVHPRLLEEARLMRKPSGASGEPSDDLGGQPDDEDAIIELDALGERRSVKKAGRGLLRDVEDL